MAGTNVTTTEQRQALVRKWLGAGSINVFGIQFAGKDTQCRRLAAWTDGVILGGGDISRHVGELSEHARVITQAGGLIPIEDFLAMATPFLSRTEFAGRPLILSAVGRWHGEEEGVMKAAEEAGHPTRAAVLLELDEDQVWERWRLMHERGDREWRVDDSEEGLNMRLQEFRNKTLPVIAFYRERGLLLVVDGSMSPDEVEAAILDGLYERASNPTP